MGRGCLGDRNECHLCKKFWMGESLSRKGYPPTALMGGWGRSFKQDGSNFCCQLRLLGSHYTSRAIAYVCAYAITMDATVSLARLISWLTSLVTSLICWRWLPFQAFLDTVALPASVFAPVDFSQGFQVLISSACLALRSFVHLFMIRP